MITNRFEEWKERQRLVGVQQGMQQGIERGRAEGERALVLRLIQYRFGELLAALRLRLEGASEAELERLADQVLDATSVHDLLQ